MSEAALKRYEGGGGGRRHAGWAVVLALHALAAWALVSGTARRGLELIQKPLEAVVIQEVIIPPPPPPPQVEPQPKPQPKVQPTPQPKVQPAPQPKVQAPPFVPPPEVAVAPSAAPVIAAASTPPVAAPAIAPPPAPEPPKPAERVEIGVICPTQVKPEMPRRALQDGMAGVVRAQVTIVNGAVKNVTILSGPQVFHAAVREAMLQYKCNGDAGEVRAAQEFVFKVE